MTHAIGISEIFLAGYMACVIVLNLVVYLISAFYRRKFALPVMQAGFLVAIGAFVLFTAVLLAGGAERTRGVLPATVVIIGTASSAINALRLYYIMSRSRK